VGFQERFQPVIRLWNHLIEPVEAIQSEEKRQESRILAGLLLAIILLLVLILPLRYLSNTNSQTPIRLAATGIGVVTLLAAYQLARRGRNQAAALMAIILATLLIFGTAVALDTSIGVTSLYYLAVISVFASLFLPLPAAFLVAVLHIVGLVLLPLLDSAYEMKRIIDGPLSFSLVPTLTVLVFAWYRNRLEAQRSARLATDESRYRLISDFIVGYAFSYGIDDQGNWIHEWVTESFERVTGYPGHEMDSIQGRVYHPDDKAALQAAWEATMRGETVNSECRIITRDKQIRWLKIYRRPIWDAQLNRVVRYYGVAQDITSQKEAEAEHLKTALQTERLKLLDGFIAAVSHDFRTSLATIETNRYLIEKTFNSIDPLKTVGRLTTIQQSVAHLTQQLENLHTLSALVAPKTETSVMNKLVNDLILLQVPAAQRKNIALTFTPELYLSPVLADMGEVRRAINHLLLNALNYTPDGGKVNVRTYQANKMVSVEIRDSGIGIEPDALEHIFEFFYRADSSRSLESGGVGLGLSIVRMIAEAHNGTVTVTSAPGQGSTFTFSLPALPAETSRAAS